LQQTKEKNNKVDLRRLHREQPGSLATATRSGALLEFSMPDSWSEEDDSSYEYLTLQVGENGC
jgi:hypothetical protein